MSTRRVLLWDVMSTLVRDPFYEDIPRFFGMSLAQLVEAKSPDAWPRFERGEIDEAQLARTFFADGRAFDLAGLKATMRDGYAWLPGLEAIVADLADAGVEMHVLSNYPGWYAMIEDALGLSRYLRWTFVSCITGLRKPDPRAYRHAVSALGLGPDRVTFVDDRDDNCEAARRAGLSAIRFADAATLRQALQGADWPV